MDSLSPSLVEEEPSEAYKNFIILSTPKQRRECTSMFSLCLCSSVASKKEKVADMMVMQQQDKPKIEDKIRDYITLHTSKTVMKRKRIRSICTKN